MRLGEQSPGRGSVILSIVRRRSQSYPKLLAGNMSEYKLERLGIGGICFSQLSTEPQGNAVRSRTPQAGRLAGPAALLAGLRFFMLLPALLFSHTEGWSYEESFYFIFVMPSTVGFSDHMSGWGEGGW